MNMTTTPEHKKISRQEDVMLLDMERRLIATCSPAAARHLQKKGGIVRVAAIKPYTLQLVRNIELTELNNLLINFGSATPTITTG